MSPFDFAAGFALSASLATNIIVWIAWRMMVQNFQGTITQIARAGDVAHMLFFIDHSGDAHEVCPCPGCRDFLKVFIKESEECERAQGPIEPVSCYHAHTRMGGLLDELDGATTDRDASDPGRE